jgi:hypothetical protein
MIRARSQEFERPEERQAVDPAAPGGRPYPQQPYSQQPYGQQPYGQQPYGPYGQPPYGPHLQVPQQQPGLNGLAIAALVLGIVCCIPPLGLVLGLVALSQIRRKGQRGKGMAVTGVVLSSISTLLMLVFFATGEAGDAWRGFREGMKDASRTTSTFDLRRGDCFDIPGPEVEEELETASVRTVDCDKAHDAEVTGAFTLDGADGYPGSEEADADVQERCQAINDAYVDPAAVPSNAELYYYVPTEDSWRIGDRTVTCAYAATEGKLTGTLRDRAPASVPEAGGTGV